MTLTALNASSGVLQSRVTPKPEPSDHVLEPLAPAGIGAIPTLNLACSRALIRSHGSSWPMSLCAQNPYFGGLVKALASAMNSSVVQPVAGSFNPAALKAS